MPIESIPRHLQQYVSLQDPSLYTAIDHAAWRFIMHLSMAFFKEKAHPKYLEGLAATGIDIEHIPLIEVMDQRLQQFGWRAVVVKGFIPPSAFLEFLSLAVLPIACDMRQVEHLEYTPAPDIVHEAAGHAPIIADPNYRRYLHKFGEIARRAIFAKEDLLIYEAIRELSDIKEDPEATPEQIQAAQERLEQAYQQVRYTSEATKLSRLGWWSIEYGLIRVKKADEVGATSSYLIYGAGLLSSVSESYHCLEPAIKKLPLDLDCVDVDYDITRPQPQLFYADDFSQLERVIDQLADTMAFRQGGAEGLREAHRAETLNTVELETGLQISGVLNRYDLDSRGQPIFLKFTGPCQLAVGENQLPHQGPKWHAHGYSTPLGRISALGITAAELTPRQLEEMGFVADEVGELGFASGIRLRGVLRGRIERNGKNLVLTFSNCEVKAADGEQLFRPEWGDFDLACGAAVVSVFGGAADRTQYIEETEGIMPRALPQKSNIHSSQRDLIPIYQDVRQAREANRGEGRTLSGERIASWRGALTTHPDEWLLRFEILELVWDEPLLRDWRESVHAELTSIAKRSRPQLQSVIGRALQLLEHGRWSH